MTNAVASQPRLAEHVQAFLAKGVPFAGTPAYEDWKQECLRLGRSAPRELVRALRCNASEMEKYGAVLALRLLGFEAFGEGYGKNLKYVVRGPKGRLLKGHSNRTATPRRVPPVRVKRAS